MKLDYFEALDGYRSLGVMPEMIQQMRDFITEYVNTLQPAYPFPSMVLVNSDSIEFHWTTNPNFKIVVAYLFNDTFDVFLLDKVHDLVYFKKPRTYLKANSEVLDFLQTVYSK